MSGGRIELKAVYDNNLVFLSVLIAFVGSYMCISLVEQLRLLTVTIYDARKKGGRIDESTKSSEDSRVSSGNSAEVVVKSLKQVYSSKIALSYTILVSMACAVGGVGIWSMHMVGMASMMLMYDDGTEVDMTFKVDLTLISLFAVIVCCFVGMKIASQDKMFAKRKSEIAEEFIHDAKFMSMSEIRGIDPKQIFVIMTTRSLSKLIAGGLIAATGICIMHYVGVMGMEFGGEIVYDAGILTASCVIALVAAIAAFWILFRLLSIYPRMESLRVVSSLIFTIAKCGMHYTGMAAAKFYIPSGHPAPTEPSATHLSQQEILNGALIATFLVSWFIIMLIFSDLRQSNNLLNHQVMIAERTIYDAKHDKSVVMINYSISRYAFVKPAEIYAPRVKVTKADEIA